MDIVILTPDGTARIGAIVAVDIATAQKLYPGMLCVERGTGADLTAVDPPKPVMAQPVATVTPRQARLALLAAGKLSAVTAALNAMSGAQGEAARITWEYATEIRRDDPLVAALNATLGIDADALFAVAAAL